MQIEKAKNYEGFGFFLNPILGQSFIPPPI
jgi:hypothetical protein